MTRGLSGAAITASQANATGLFVLLELLLDSGAFRVCTAGQDVSWNGYTWLAVGQLGKISAIEETEGGQVKGLQLELSSIPSGILNTALVETFQGRACNVYVAFLNLPQHTIIATPVNEWAGTLDVMAISDDGQTGMIQVTAENALFDFARPVPLNWSDSEQQALYVGDLGLQYVPQMAIKQITWPAASYFMQQ
jgi:hypothetical protein